MNTQDITNTVVRFFAAVDQREWPLIESSMTTPFFLDYSSFGAGPGTALEPAEVVNGWKGLLPGFDATQHQLGALEIDAEGEALQVRANVTAIHWIEGAEGGPCWTVYGHYELGLKQHQGRWKLSSLTFHFRFITGNATLPALAASRATTDAR